MIKLGDLYEKTLIVEAFSLNALNKAMDDRRVISIYYDSPHDTTNDKGWRRIEPMVYGKNKHGNDVLRSWQLGGASDTPEGRPDDPLTRIPGWRLFRVDGIKNINIGGGDVITEERPKYNPKDKDMTTIYKAILFNDGEVSVASNDRHPDNTSSTDSKPIDTTVPSSTSAKPTQRPVKPSITLPNVDMELGDKPSWVKNFVKTFKDVVLGKKK